MKRILITDDSSVMRRNLKKILSEAGYEIVAEAANGEEALDAYEKHRPDLVTMDITMPVMDGLEAVKRLVKRHPDARIVVISAFDQRSMLFEALENGAKQYIIKPITEAKLLNGVLQALGEPEAAPAGDAAADETAPLFRIDNREGRFVVRLTNPQLAGGLDELRTAVQGLLFVKPLRLVFHFGNAAECHPQLPSLLETLIGAIRQSGGEVSLVAAHEGLASALRPLLSIPIAAQ